MTGVSLKELWMLLGEKDVQIYQLLREIEILTAQVTELTKKLTPDKEETPSG